MQKATLLLIPLFFLMVIMPVYAPAENQTIDLLNFDDAVGEALNIGPFAGGLICTLLIVVIVLIIVGIATKDSPNALITLLITFLSICFCIAVGWFPIWGLVILVLLIAIALAREGGVLGDIV